MKKILSLTLLLGVLLSIGCGTSNNSKVTKTDLGKELETTNRGNVSLLQRIRQKPGIIISGGVPIINKTANTFSSGGSQEPLYVLNSQIIGNSFRSIDELVDNFIVKKITILTGARASSYGSRGANGVILITTD